MRSRTAGLQADVHRDTGPPARAGVARAGVLTRGPRRAPVLRVLGC